MSNCKKQDYLSWEDYFMAVAFLAAKRSKDPCTQVGACIVDPSKVIVGVGYNGMPIGLSDNVMPWGKGNDDPLENKKFYVCHAEANAILLKTSMNLKGCTIYTSLFPCNECAKCIIQSGITTVVYQSDKLAHKESTDAAKLMLNAAGVTCRRFEPSQKKILIDFDDISNDYDKQHPASS